MDVDADDSLVVVPRRFNLVVNPFFDPQYSRRLEPRYKIFRRVGRRSISESPWSPLRDLFPVVIRSRLVALDDTHIPDAGGARAQSGL